MQHASRLVGEWFSLAADQRADESFPPQMWGSSVVGRDGVKSAWRRAEHLCVMQAESTGHEPLFNRRRLDMADVSRRLLGRDDQGELSFDARRLVEDRRVVITGAAGSIGGELVRQITRLGAETYLLDHDESRLHGLHLELSGSGLLEGNEIVLADVRDRPRLSRVFAALRPDVVFHAAAHKHLQLLERAPAEAVKTNVYGTQNVVDAALDAGAERFVLISTDKAAEPSSVLGASKLLAEYVTQATAHHGMRVASVRFGNVLGSRGSLLDTLRWQLANGLPVTITHPDVTRFFMSIPEAVSLVLEAALMAEHGETYVLDMGEPIRIIDIVERFSELTGWPVASYIFSGLRPGEKLHEVLAAPHEPSYPTAHPSITMIPSGLVGSRIEVLFDLLPEIYRASLRDQNDRVRDMLFRGAADLRAPLRVAADSVVPSTSDKAVANAANAANVASVANVANVDTRAETDEGAGGEVLLGV